MRRTIICFFITSFIWFSAKSQLASTTYLTKKPVTDSPYAINSNTFRVNFQKTTNISPVKTVPSSFYKNTLGFFCQRELELEKAVKFPVKFRLGSLEYTDKMEGKGTGTRFLGQRK